MRPVLTLLLALVLAATSLTMATARGHARMAGTIVLCSGAGPVSVPVDASGRPTGPVHLCPDCALSLIAATAVAPAEPPMPLLRLLGRVAPSAPPAAAALAAPRAQSRGPPIPV